MEHLIYVVMMVVIGCYLFVKGYEYRGNQDDYYKNLNKDGE